MASITSLKNELFHLLLSNLDRDLNELFTLCEYEGNDAWVEETWTMLIEGGATFGEVSPLAGHCARRVRAFGATRVQDTTPPQTADHNHIARDTSPSSQTY